MTWLLTKLVRAYQILLSPLLPDACRFQPSCSQYFIDAVRTRGPIRGSLMGIWRFLRCNPFSKGGYDPVDKDCLKGGTGRHAYRIPEAAVSETEESDR